VNFFSAKNSIPCARPRPALASGEENVPVEKVSPTLASEREGN
jgi:hypothetical protein